MRISQHYGLGRTQATMDFVDVDIVNDTPVFLSPKALTMLPSEFGDECVHLVQNFFQTVLDYIRGGKNHQAEALLRELREPNETRLGLSSGKAQGHALGSGSAHNVWESLSQSEAAKSGLLEDLEDTVLMIEGISVDIVSDMTTNIIRAPLIRYTQRMCEQYGIPTSPGVDSGPLWNSIEKRWYSEFVELPIAGSGRLIFVPKVLVRTHLQYDAGEYFRHFLLTRMQQAELAANTELVEIVKSGKGKRARTRKRVTKKALLGKYGTGKKAIVAETRKHPDALATYKALKRDEKHLPLTLEDMSSLEGAAETDWAALLHAVRSVPTGQADAGRYEKAVEGIISALFYPNLTNPNVQHEIHNGRKRIDVTYTNMGVHGFFKWLATHYSSAHVFVECKNYGKEVGNPELDQLSGRFSPSRGQVGILVCRQFHNKTLFLQRCADTAKDSRGFIMALDDDDLASLTLSREDEPLFAEWKLLRSRFDALIN
ncbi:hypothetical protein S23_05140 [Bradyrhizobium cosmicum]|uniref:Restriction endonuclease type IV Mrr domain-containing protein n=2 Tax=Bradyrhizobium cosmicum TaxID=1404864 RepID=A0AAI8Q9Y3_9BRAD|nr:hypothetical protein S23_05140 [Bradyrhizobium cosmicum]